MQPRAYTDTFFNFALLIFNFLLLRYLIRFYQIVISPLLPANQCRFEPSCSNYALEAFEHHPFFTALWLSVKRIGKCHPFHKGGFDPVPAPKNTHL